MNNWKITKMKIKQNDFKKRKNTNSLAYNFFLKLFISYNFAFCFTFFSFYFFRPSSIFIVIDGNFHLSHSSSSFSSLFEFHHHHHLQSLVSYLPFLYTNLPPCFPLVICEVYLKDPTDSYQNLHQL